MNEELELITMGVPYSEAVSIVYFCRKDGSLQDVMKDMRQKYREKTNGSPSEK